MLCKWYEKIEYVRECNQEGVKIFIINILLFGHNCFIFDYCDLDSINQNT